MISKERRKEIARNWYYRNKNNVKTKSIEIRQTLKNKEYMSNYYIENTYKTWDIYLKYLISFNKQRRIDGLTIQELKNILQKQYYNCAISGIPLTHTRGSPYNASIDRIIPKGSYTPENIQIVCKCLNTLRGNIPIQEYINICFKIVEFQNDKNNIRYRNNI